MAGTGLAHSRAVRGVSVALAAVALVWSAPALSATGASPAGAPHAALRHAVAVTSLDAVLAPHSLTAPVDPARSIPAAGGPPPASRPDLLGTVRDAAAPRRPVAIFAATCAPRGPPDVLLA
jgi:hypothetical protein